MFALRNRGTADAVDALGAAFGARSALLKHEVAYVLGQMQNSGALDVLWCACYLLLLTGWLGYWKQSESNRFAPELDALILASNSGGSHGSWRTLANRMLCTCKHTAHLTCRNAIAGFIRASQAFGHVPSTMFS